MGSTSNTMAGAPFSYSEIPTSPFYLMVKQVYDVSQMLTPGQKEMAVFWRDVRHFTRALDQHSSAGGKKDECKA
jgi:hypothetical protein